MLPSDYISKGWCQNVNARGEHGTPVPWDDPFATSFCMSGALVKSYSEEGITRQQRVMIANHLRLKLGDTLRAHEGFIVWQDNPDRTKEEVLAIMLEAEKEILYVTQ